MKILGQKVGPCRLCGDQGSRCGSHIVPEFCYQYEEGPGNSRCVIAVDHDDKGKRQDRRIQKGDREYLLCDRCEQRLSKHERYFSQLWSKELKGSFQKDQRLLLKNVNYHHFKTFVLSVFWRAHISQILGRYIPLGPYGEKLRKVILSDKPIPRRSYPIMVRLLLDKNGHPITTFISNPTRVRYDFGTRYNMCFASCEWSLFVTEHKLPVPFDVIEDYITERGEVCLWTEAQEDNRTFLEIREKLI